MHVDRVDLRASSLMEAAAATCGLSDFGPDDVATPLQALTDSVREEGQLTAEGLEALQNDILRQLVNRLRYQHDLARHPEIADEKVDDPVVVIGMPRTGTTKVQRSLAADPGLQSLQLYRAVSPAPLPGDEGDAQRIAMAAGFIEVLKQTSPEFLAAHPMDPMEAEEEMWIQLGAYDGPASWGMFYRVPSYVRWLEGRSKATSYHYLHSQLQYLQWQDGGRRNRPWVLKTPLHLGSLDALCAAFPSAVAVHCHRDIAIAMASTCRLIETARAVRGAARIDRVELGAYLSDFWSQEWRRNLAQRATLPTSAMVLDIDYADIMADTDAILQSIYDARGLALTDPAKQRVAAWTDTSDPHRFGRHTYRLDDYGLSVSDVLAAFDFYVARFPATEPAQQRSQ